MYVLYKGEVSKRLANTAVAFRLRIACNVGRPSESDHLSILVRHVALKSSHSLRSVSSDYTSSVFGHRDNPSEFAIVDKNNAL